MRVGGEFGGGGEGGPRRVSRRRSGGGLADHASFEFGNLGGERVVGLVRRVGGEMDEHVIRHCLRSFQLGFSIFGGRE